MPGPSTSSTVVIFGATGDLTRRKLVPALYNLCRKNELPAQTHIVGFSIEPYALDDFRARLRAGVLEFSPATFDASVWDTFARMLHYRQGDLTNPDDFHQLHAAFAGA